eukprot:m.81807 g.81807  ORF g.81807 m.81807 type:complete len:446 (-) comp25452_c1_seq1:151-1488(-)
MSVAVRSMFRAPRRFLEAASTSNKIALCATATNSEHQNKFNTSSLISPHAAVTQNKDSNHARPASKLPFRLQGSPLTAPRSSLLSPTLASPFRNGQVVQTQSRRGFSTTPARCESSPESVVELGWFDTLKIGMNNDFIPQIVQAGDVNAAGLGGMNPAAMLRQGIEWICVNGDLSWAGGIIVTTVMLKVAMLPLAVMAQRNTVKMHNCMPQAKVVQDRLKACKERGDQPGVAAAAQQMGEVYAKHDCHPVKGLGLVLVQMPVFMSFFFALRNMAHSEIPIDSLVHGGAYWFHDLTQADPLHILPVLSIASMAILIEVSGAETMSSTMKLFFRGFFVVILGVTYNFPAAVFLYWVTNNSLSLVQAGALRMPAVQALCGIPDKIPLKIDPNAEENQFSFSKAMEAYKDTEKAEKFVENTGAKVSREAAIASLKRHHNERKNRKNRRN